MKPAVSPSNAAVRDVVWSSNKPKVAKVNANGTVTGVSKGTTVISAVTLDGKFKASCTVTVK